MQRPIAWWWTWAIGLLLANICSSLEKSNVYPMREEPAYYYVGCYTARTDLLKESVYAKIPKTCIEICVQEGHIYAVLATENCFCASYLKAQERLDEKLCNTRCLANKAQYCGGVGVHSYYSTKQLRQPAPNHLRLVNTTENSISIVWDAYEPNNLLVSVGTEGLTPQANQVSKFIIKCQVVHSYSSLPVFEQPEFVVQSTETEFELTDLHPATHYNISVYAMCIAQQLERKETECGHATLSAATKVGVPYPVPVQPKIITRTDYSITVELAPMQNDNGPLSKLLIIVEYVNNALRQTFDAQLLGSWQESQQNGVPYYIAAELDYDRPEDNRTKHFVVGDGKLYGRYHNVPLKLRSDDQQYSSHVHISLGVVSTLQNFTKTLYTRRNHEQHTTSLDDFRYATFERGQSSVVALAVTCIIFGSCLLLSIITYFYLRYETCQSRVLSERLRNTHEMTPQISVIEQENNGYLVEEDLPPTLDSFKQQLEALIAELQHIPRCELRINVNDVIGEGAFGNIITGMLCGNGRGNECAMHVLSTDKMKATSQCQLLDEMQQLKKLQRHEQVLDFCGISASADWLYLVMELQSVSLKQRLLESRHEAPIPRLSSLSEQLVLQWMYELSSAAAYLNSLQVQQRHLSSYSVYVTTESKLKLCVLGPLYYVNANRQQCDPRRWLSPEMLREKHHITSKSAVWSFACIAWECCALGGTLYGNVLSGEQHLLDAIRSGMRPTQPVYVFSDLYQILLNCWQVEPSERIGFEDVAFAIRQLMTSPKHAICFDRSMSDTDTLETLPLYLPMLETRNS
ncbi:Wsck [Drosophila busckii]|uniref:Wsck n=3 Tax=Drosophila busckii TaxID=30019 RepID=A0A0M4EL23_DROBS|nr:Wsck [Drosophila busckii]